MSLYELAKLGGYLLSPLTVGLLLGLAGVGCAVRRKARLACGFGVVALGVMWVSATPLVAAVLTESLEQRYPARTVSSTPHADALVILGGALSGAHPPERPSFSFGPAAGRVWHAASLFNAGKARWIVIAAGGPVASPRQQVEADAIREMLLVLGVPDSAIRREAQSRNTIENAANVRNILMQLRAHRVLIVTSAQHMPRAMKVFTSLWTGSGLEILPAATDYGVPAGDFTTPQMWLPDIGALTSTASALKEYEGMLALDIVN